jgi:hypothetical protein
MCSRILSWPILLDVSIRRSELRCLILSSAGPLVCWIMKRWNDLTSESYHPEKQARLAVSQLPSPSPTPVAASPSSESVNTASTHNGAYRDAGQHGHPSSARLVCFGMVSLPLSPSGIECKLTSKTAGRSTISNSIERAPTYHTECRSTLSTAAVNHSPESR